MLNIFRIIQVNKGFTASFIHRITASFILLPLQKYVYWKHNYEIYEGKNKNLVLVKWP